MVNWVIITLLLSETLNDWISITSTCWTAARARTLWVVRLMYMYGRVYLLVRDSVLITWQWNTSMMTNCMMPLSLHREGPSAAWHVLQTLMFTLIFSILRLHRMHAIHEVQPIVTDVCGVCPSVCPSVRQSVCLSCGSSQLPCAKMAEQIKMLFGMNTSGGGPQNIVLHGGPDPPIDRGRGTYFLILGPLSCLRNSWSWRLEILLAYTGRRALMKTMQKLIIWGRGGVTRPPFKFWDLPRISGMAEARLEMLHACTRLWILSKVCRVGYSGGGGGSGGDRVPSL